LGSLKEKEYKGALLFAATVILGILAWGFFSVYSSRSSEVIGQQLEIIQNLELGGSNSSGPLFELTSWNHRSYGNIDEWNVSAKGSQQASEGKTASWTIEFNHKQRGLNPTVKRDGF
jgi:hypothetical protein